MSAREGSTEGTANLEWSEKLGHVRHLVYIPEKGASLVVSEHPMYKTVNW